MTPRPALQARIGYAAADIGLRNRVSRDFDSRARDRLILSSHIEDGAMSRIVLGPIDQPVRNVRGRIEELL